MSTHTTHALQSPSVAFSLHCQSLLWVVLGVNFVHMAAMLKFSALPQLWLCSSEISSPYFRKSAYCCPGWWRSFFRRPSSYLFFQNWWQRGDFKLTFLLGLNKTNWVFKFWWSWTDLLIHRLDSISKFFQCQLETTKRTFDYAGASHLNQHFSPSLLLLKLLLSMGSLDTPIWALTKLPRIVGEYS